MSVISKKVLQALDFIYKFVEGQSGPLTVDLDSPVVLVHDVSRNAALGSGINNQLGYYIHQTVNVHGSGGQLFDTYDPWTEIDALSIPRNLVSVWLVDMWAQTDTALSIDVIQTAALFPTVPGSFQGESLPLRNWGGGEFQSVDSGGTIRPAHLEVENVPRSLPMFMPDPTTILVVTDALIAATLSQHTMFWAGAKGTTPPGMA